MSYFYFPKCFWIIAHWILRGTINYPLLGNVTLPQVYLILQSCFSRREQGYVKGRDHLSLQGSYAMQGQGLCLRNSRESWGKRGLNTLEPSKLGMGIIWVFRFRVPLEAQIKYLAQPVFFFFKVNMGIVSGVLDEYRKALNPHTHSPSRGTKFPCLEGEHW